MDYLSKRNLNFVKPGNFKRVLCLLFKNYGCCILDLKISVLEDLNSNQSRIHKFHGDLLLSGPVVQVDEFFSNDHTELIQKAASITKKAAAPLKFETNDLRCILV